MKIQDPQIEAVNTTLADLVSTANDTDLRPYPVQIGQNMGFTTLQMSIPIDKFFDMSEVANERNVTENGEYEGQAVAQRGLDTKHAERLATYILKGLFASAAAAAKGKNIQLPEEFETMQDILGTQPYLALQPITANIRSCDFGGGGLRVEKLPNGSIVVYLGRKHVLWVVDGQHRREAMLFVFEFLKAVTTAHRYPRRELYPGGNNGDRVPASELQVWNMILQAWRTSCTVMCEVHLGLNAEQERQLFYDLNNLTKKVSANLAFSFDNSNPINVFIKHELIQKPGALFEDKVVERDNVPWGQDKGEIARKDLVAINALLFLNKGNIRGAVPLDVQSNTEYAHSFWSAVSKIPNYGSHQAKLKTVAAQSVVIKTLAKLAYTFKLGRSPDEDAYEALLEAIPALDYSHGNPMWRFARLTEAERRKVCPGLEDYLVNGVAEVGSYDESANLFRFSPLHNDIMPTLGDMLRWGMKLPNRKLE